MVANAIVKLFPRQAKQLSLGREPCARINLSPKTAILTFASTPGPPQRVENCARPSLKFRPAPVPFDLASWLAGSVEWARSSGEAGVAACRTSAVAKESPPSYRSSSRQLQQRRHRVVAATTTRDPRKSQVVQTRIFDGQAVQGRIGESPISFLGSPLSLIIKLSMKLLSSNAQRVRAGNATKPSRTMVTGTSPPTWRSSSNTAWCRQTAREVSSFGGGC